MAIQVSYNPKKSTETWERESTALIKLSKVLDCKRLIILMTFPDFSRHFFTL